MVLYLLLNSADAPPTTPSEKGTYPGRCRPSDPPRRRLDASNPGWPRLGATLKAVLHSHFIEADSIISIRSPLVRVLLPARRIMHKRPSYWAIVPYLIRKHVR